jgi:hypothetical protein
LENAGADRLPTADLHADMRENEEGSSILDSGGD